MSLLYLAVFDPLDGSSNIDVNISIGTIFGVLKKESVGPATEADFLRPGRELLAAGYVIYGSSTMFVISTGKGVRVPQTHRMADFLGGYGEIIERSRIGVRSIESERSIGETVAHLAPTLEF